MQADQVVSRVINTDVETPPEGFDKPPSGVVIKMAPDDVLFIGQVRIDVTKRTNDKVSFVVSASDEMPIVLLRDGKVRIGRHHRMSKVGPPSDD